MGRRYYCDFCDRSFADNAENRKKHLNGVQHQILKKLHYDEFRDAATILAEELTKRPCKRFRQAGNCDFGGGCRFSHYSPDDIQRLREQVDQERFNQHMTLPSHNQSGSTRLDSWLAKRAEKLASGAATKNSTTSTASSSSSSSQTTTLNWKLPAQLQSTANSLPPSVIPPSIFDFTEENISTWG